MLRGRARRRRSAGAAATRPGPRSSTGRRRSPSGGTCGRTACGVAEAMDTAQRGMGLDWAATQELIRRSVAEAQAVGGRLACGAGTDQLPPGRRPLDEVRAAYEEQCAFVEGEGAPVILMAQPRAGRRGARSRRLPRASTAHVLAQASRAGDPALARRHVRPGCSPATGARRPRRGRRRRARASSPRTPTRSTASRSRCSTPTARSRCGARLPEGVRMYTGDDFNYPELIAATSRHSDALLGIFDAIAPAAAAALHALDAGRPGRATRRCSRRPCRCRATSFAAPTSVLQDGRRLPRLPQRPPGALPDGRRAGERALDRAPGRAVRLADQAGLLRDPELAAARMRLVLALAGVA